MIIKGEKRHAFLAADTAINKLIEIDENGNIVWEFDTSRTVFDLWSVAENRILYCYYGGGTDESGVKIIDKNGDEYFHYKTKHEIFSCQPLENGGVLVGELIQKRLVETDENGDIIKIIPFDYNGKKPHETMRMARKISDNEYMVVSPGSQKIFFLDSSGKTVREYDTRHDTFGAVIRPNGNIVYSCMDGLAELDKDGNEVWTVLKNDVPEINICWLLGIHLQPDGNIVCTNWLGHGHEGEGIPVFEVTQDKKIAWLCDCREHYPNIGNVCMLD